MLRRKIRPIFKCILEPSSKRLLTTNFCFRVRSSLHKYRSTQRHEKCISKHNSSSCQHGSSKGEGSVLYITSNSTHSRLGKYAQGDSEYQQRIFVAGIKDAEHALKQQKLIHVRKFS